MLLLSKSPAAQIVEAADKLIDCFGMTHIEISKDIFNEDKYVMRAAHVATGPCPTSKTYTTQNFYRVLAIKDELISRGVSVRYAY